MAYLKSLLAIDLGKALLISLMLSGVAMAQAPQLETLLQGGSSEAVASLERYLLANDDDEARFSLGIAHFLSAVEYMANSWYRYGLNVDVFGNNFGIPFLRIPIPQNPEPELLDNAAFREVLQEMVSRLETADTVLADIEDEDIKLEVRFDQLRLDIDGSGVAGDSERLWAIYAALNQLAMGMGEEPPPIEVAFDLGDVHWLRGYSNLLAAMLELWLAVDNQAIFDHGAHLLFPNVVSPYEILENYAELDMFLDSVVIDTVTLVYLTLALDLAEPERLSKVHSHLEEVVQQSRLSWQAIMAETDNDREWIPNPNQDSVVPVDVSAEMIEGWLEFLDEFEGILAGDILLPFWRVSPAQAGNVGLNLRRMLLEPPASFNIVLWLQGGVAEAYLEEGYVTEPETWQRINDIFGGNFIGFAVWFN